MGVAFFLFIAAFVLAGIVVFVWGGIKQLIRVGTSVWHNLSS